MAPERWSTKLGKSLGIVLMTAVTARLVWELLLPLVGVLLVGCVLAAVYGVALRR